MKKIKKRSLTLLEVIVAFTLFSMIFGLFMQLFHSTILLQTTFCKIEKNVLDKFYVYQTLQELIHQFKQTTLQGEKPLFYTINDDQKGFCLIFFTNNELDADSFFRGKNKHTFYVENKALYLETTSESNQAVSSRKKLLLGSVDQLDLLFYGEKETTKAWSKETKAPPKAMEFTLVRKKKETLRYPFYLSLKKEPITYEKSP